MSKIHLKINEMPAYYMAEISAELVGVVRRLKRPPNLIEVADTKEGGKIIMIEDKEAWHQLVAKISPRAPSVPKSAKG